MHAYFAVSRMKESGRQSLVLSTDPLSVPSLERQLHELACSEDAGLVGVPPVLSDFIYVDPRHYKFLVISNPITEALSGA